MTLRGGTHTINSCEFSTTETCLSVSEQSSIVNIIESSFTKCRRAITLSGGSVTTSDVTITESLNKAIEVSSSGTLHMGSSSISNMYITSVSGYGSAIFAADSSVTMRSVKFTNITTLAGFGAAVFVQDSELTIEQSEFTNIKSVSGGSAVHALYGEVDFSVDVSDSKFMNNSGSAGAIFSTVALTVRNSEFYYNVGYRGGAIMASYQLTINNCTIKYNTAQGTGGGGGGLYINTDQPAIVSDSTISHNRAIDGAGIYYMSSSMDALQIPSSKFQENIASHHGGGAFFASASVVMSNSIFWNNSAVEGGGVYVQGGATFSNCDFFGNSADRGGGFLFTELSTIDMTNVSVVYNNGGGIFCDSIGQSIFYFLYIFISYNYFF